MLGTEVLRREAESKRPEDHRGKPKPVQFSTVYGVHKEGGAAVPRKRYVEIRQDKPAMKEQES